MPSIRSRLADRAVRVIGLKGRLAALAEAEGDQEPFDAILKKLRRTDRRRATRRLTRGFVRDEFDVGGFPLHLMCRRGTPAKRVLLYLHGGGYMFGPFGTEWAMMRHIARQSDSDFAMLLYPRAPEHEATTTAAIARSAFELLAGRYGAAGVVIIGSSAGGGLGLAITMELRDADAPTPALLALISPGVDMSLHADVTHLTESDLLLTAEHVRSAGAIYAGDLGVDHPLVSPGLGDLGDLPRTHVFAGSEELLLPSIRSFVEQATAAGSPVTLVVGSGMQHTWPAAPIPEARATRAEIAALLGSI